jgi:hypothetical protein
MTKCQVLSLSIRPAQTHFNFYLYKFNQHIVGATAYGLDDPGSNPRPLDHDPLSPLPSTNPPPSLPDGLYGFSPAGQMETLKACMAAQGHRQLLGGP